MSQVTTLSSPRTAASNVTGSHACARPEAMLGTILTISCGFLRTSVYFFEALIHLSVTAVTVMWYSPGLSYLYVVTTPSHS